MQNKIFNNNSEKILEKICCKNVQTAHNRSVYAHRRSGAGYERPQSACGLYAVFLRHILARRNASHCFIGGPKRHIQPERYTPFCLKFFVNY
jgi:hypothetical protein